ncbi:MAG: CoA transferase [Rhodobacteraceae bacterium]|nr:CoA transferase [Paracoccaceae bacterium]
MSDLAVASIAAVGAALVALIGDERQLVIDQRLAALWFSTSLYPQGWELPPIWDALAGDYACKDGWIRLHTNLPHHRSAALAVLGAAASRNTVAAAAKNWGKDALEAAIVAQGGVAAAMRSAGEWKMHPQGQAVLAEPLIQWSGKRERRPWNTPPERPLKGLKVLDMTRVLAGPVATRTLAGFGAEVLRIDPPGWEEANVVPDITLGKRCARLDLKDSRDRKLFEALLGEADILVHGYRPGALAGLGYGSDERRAMAPDLLEVSLDAYGWSGPWAKRRGFDSLVQMSCGIAEAGMHWAKRDIPVPLPVQALDHATGYLMAAAAIRMLAGNGAMRARLSLARTAGLLMETRQDKAGTLSKMPEAEDFAQPPEATPWGAAHRLRPPLQVEGVPMRWHRGACALGSYAAAW